MASNPTIAIHKDELVPVGEVLIDEKRRCLIVHPETFELLKQRMKEADEHHTETSRDAEPDGEEGEGADTEA